MNAVSYPIIDLRSGNRVIVDLYNDLPKKMEEIITSSWENYRIVHLEGDEDLRSAFDKIMLFCNYKEMHRMDEPLVLGGDIPLRITADWIIRLDPESSAEKVNTIIVTLNNNNSSGTPYMIRNFLEEERGIRIVEYPSPLENADIPIGETEILKAGDDNYSLVEMLLNLTGQTFSKREEIPLYQGKDTDFDLIIKADFSLNIAGKDCIIDISGLGPDIVTLLKENRFYMLSISDKESSTAIVTKVLEFLGVEFDSNIHSFLAADRAESKNIRLMIQGTIFRDNKEQTIFATDLRLSPDIINFLTGKGYRILSLPVS